MQGWPEDVRRAAGACLEALEPLVGGDWSVPAGELDWNAETTLRHIVEGLTFYARDLATPVLSVPEHEARITAVPDASVAGLVDAVGQMSAVLAGVVAGTEPQVRAFHRAGMADRTGFAAMACDELLVHTADICAGLDAVLAPPDELCERVLGRLFPWAPSEGPAWQRLLWANGRTALPGRPRLGPGWTWHAAPLDEAGFAVRQERAGDELGVRAVHLSAFEASEEADLVDALRATDAFAPELSLVAVDGDEAIGHVLLTRVELDDGPGLALAPMAVLPGRQRQAVGWALGWAAVDAAERLAERLVVVLGHPGYYPRFGFVPAGPLGIRCPYEAPAEAWMALVLGADHPRGLVRYAEPFEAADR